MDAISRTFPRTLVKTRKEVTCDRMDGQRLGTVSRRNVTRAPANKLVGNNPNAPSIPPGILCRTNHLTKAAAEPRPENFRKWTRHNCVPERNEKRISRRRVFRSSRAQRFSPSRYDPENCDDNDKIVVSGRFPRGF